MPDWYSHIDYAKPAAPKSEAELATDSMTMELQRTTAAGRLTLPEVRTLIARLIELGWTAPAKAVP